MTVSPLSRPALLTLLLTAIAFAEGCRAIEGIFKAGMFVGIFIAAVVVLAIFWIVRSIGT
jgi:hypothetical protein